VRQRYRRLQGSRTDAIAVGHHQQLLCGRDVPAVDDAVANRDLHCRQSRYASPFAGQYAVDIGRQTDEKTGPISRRIRRRNNRARYCGSAVPLYYDIVLVEMITHRTHRGSWNDRGRTRRQVVATKRHKQGVLWKQAGNDIAYWWMSSGRTTLGTRDGSENCRGRCSRGRGENDKAVLMWDL